MKLELVKKYFDEEDKMCILSKNHPLKDLFEKCSGTSYVKRFESGKKEMFFHCSKFGSLHIVRECKDNCPDFVLCNQIRDVMDVESVIEQYTK